MAAVVIAASIATTAVVSIVAIDISYTTTMITASDRQVKGIPFGRARFLMAIEPVEILKKIK